MHVWTARTFYSLTGRSSPSLKVLGSPQTRDRVTLLCSLHNRVPFSGRVSLGCNTSCPQSLQLALCLDFVFVCVVLFLSFFKQQIELPKSVNWFCSVGSFFKASRQNLETWEKSLSSPNLFWAYTWGLIQSGVWGQWWMNIAILLH